MVKPKAPSSLRVLRGNPLYRGVTVAEFRSALGASAAAPQIASFLVKDLDASLFVVMLAPANGRDAATAVRPEARTGYVLPLSSGRGEPRRFSSQFP
ncbi:hypothetical protein ACFVGX_04475 [Streptomyces sp. NPDC127113]|uniref:hypothetical protein n=1 Tax=unclassified Streptomyces TaxID=2593676 RepID=UPI0033A4BC63